MIRKILLLTLVSAIGGINADTNIEDFLAALATNDQSQVRRIVKSDPALLNFKFTKNNESITLLSLAIIFSSNFQKNLKSSITTNGEMIEFLIKNNACVNAHSTTMFADKQVSRQTPLHVAVATANVTAVKILLAHKAKIDSKNSEGDTALDLAHNYCATTHCNLEKKDFGLPLPDEEFVRMHSKLNHMIRKSDRRTVRLLEKSAETCVARNRFARAAACVIL